MSEIQKICAFLNTLKNLLIFDEPEVSINKKQKMSGKRRKSRRMGINNHKNYQVFGMLRNAEHFRHYQSKVEGGIPPVLESTGILPMI